MNQYNGLKELGLNIEKLKKPMTVEFASRGVSRVWIHMQQYVKTHPDEEIVGFVTRRKENGN